MAVLLVDVPTGITTWPLDSHACQAISCWVQISDGYCINSPHLLLS